MVGDELRPGGAFAVLLFHAAVVFSVMHSCRGETGVLGPSQPIVALVGTDVVLPCSLRPVVDASDLTVEWTRPDLDPKFILVWRDAVELEFKKNPAFRDRTSLFINELKQGNVSLKLSSVKLSDRGMYRCFPPELNKDATVELVVGAASSPVIQMSNNSTNGEGDGVVVLRCESRGWYPEPEVLWLDSEGNPLSAGPPETVRGPGDLYNVSSRLTVDKRHSNNFTCRVQQKNINQTREAHIHVPDPSTPGSSSPIAAIIGVIVALVVIVAVSVFVWKWRQRRLKNKKHPNDEEMLTEKKKKDPSTQSLMEKGRDGETAEDEDTETHPGLHPQTQDETHQIQTNQGERKEGEGITERKCLDNRKEETETEHGRNTDNKMKEEPEMENNHQTEEGEKTTQRRGDEMESQRLMDEGKDGGGPLNDENKEKRKKMTNVQTKKKKKKKETRTEEAEVQNVKDERKDGEELKDKEKEKLKRKLQAKEREEKKGEERLSRLKSQIEIKEKQMNELLQQLEEVEREMESEKPLETKKDLEKKKSELQKDLEKMKREKERMKKEETVMIERIKKDRNEKEEIIRKLEEMEKQRNEGENQNDSDDEL